MKKQNAIGYVRISNRDQSRYSLDSQETAISNYCKDNGLNLTALFKDNGAKSFSFERTEWFALERFVKSHRGAAQYLIIVYYDRFSRNISEPFPMIDKLQHKYNIKVLFRNEPIDIDPDDPVVFMQRVTGFAQANYERLIIRERTKQGLRRAMEQGRVVNAAPFGYKNHKDERGKSYIVVDAEKARIIQKIFRDFIAGIPIAEIYRKAKIGGFSMTSHSAIRRVLSNCMYAGLIKVPATSKIPLKYVQALHQPLVSKEDFSLAQQILDERPAHKSQPEESMPLRGVLRCTCGAKMTAGWSRGRKKRYLYYRCIRHANVNMPGQKLHELFGELVNTLTLRKEQIEYIQNKTAEILKEHLTECDKLLQVRNRELIGLKEKIEKLEDKMINDEIDQHFYGKWQHKYGTAKSEMLAIIKELEKDKGYIMLRLQERLPLLLNIAALYQEGTHELRQQLLNNIFRYGISYSEGTFKAPYIDPVFNHTIQKLKEMGILIIERPGQILERYISGC